MYDWKKEFSRHILEQGKACFEAGKVIDLKESAGVVTAGVLERRRFDVWVAPRNGKEGYLQHCHCPVARGGARCKHMAAVMYAMEAAEKQQEKTEQEKTEQEKTERERTEQEKTEQEKTEQEKAEREKTGQEKAERERTGPEKTEQEKAEREKTGQEKTGQEKENRRKTKREEAPRQMTLDEFITEDRAADEDEEEYIVLNRGEDAEEAETGRQGYGSEEDFSRYRYFDYEAIRSSMRFTDAKRRKGKELLEKKLVKYTQMSTGFAENSEGMAAEAVGEGRQGKNLFQLRLRFDRKAVLYAECGCDECRQQYYYIYYRRREYCSYLVAFLFLLQTHIQNKNLGDATDRLGEQVMQAFSRHRTNPLLPDVSGKNGSLTLAPRLCRKNGELSVSFKIGEKKLFVVKDLYQFYRDVQRAQSNVYGSNTEIVHRLEYFSEKSREWIAFINRIVMEEQIFEKRLIEADVYSRRSLIRRGEFSLFGWRLDEFYEKLGGDGVEYEEKGGDKREKGRLYPREQNPRISLTIRKNKLSNRLVFHGVEVDCRMPTFYGGNSTSYYIQGDGLYRTQEEFSRKIRILTEYCPDGSLRFEVGRNHLAQFYYNMLPQLEDVADIMEENLEGIAAYLPPRVRFVFFLDAEERNMSCRIRARYGESEFALPEQQGEGDPLRDMQREQEVLQVARQWFPYYDAQKQELDCGQDEELMYQVLNQGVETLLSLGEVHCTRRFSGMNIGRRMKVSVGVSVSKNLLELNISTQDIAPEELLEILKSYRAKKKYYRLKKGDFLSLEDNELATLDEMVEALRLSPKELAKGKVKLPLYRALYLDKLLEKNEEIYSNRDSHFREMVKNFKTVKDAGFEVPDELRGVMRGYQKTGYRWLRLLEEYQLGGILADDMGLGKTLQIIAVLLAAKKEDRRTTSLVVTPASLVYNWGEELKRFAPGLSCCFIAGSQEERTQKLARYQDFDVLVTSYDLLKRDIAGYEDKEFYYEVIDEAQYIKNHTTAAAKAVKGIRSRIRYALTGTPIENRLSELWSIFDYLIPGYLYGYEVFKNNFESPIVKEEDQTALERLQRMTAPFILRRVKENVLKDLPEKLEESRYVKFEETQQQLYDAQVIHMRQRLAMQNAEDFKKEKLKILAELMKLRQICCDPGLCFEGYRGESAKLEACVDLVRSAVEGGHKILLFSQFTSMLDLLAGRFEKEKISFYTITGETPKEKRLQLVNAFNGDGTEVFLISLKAGGVGLNLVGADVVIHYDPWWNVAVQNQATDRAHRIGQTKKVVVYRLIAKGTIEEKIQELQESKKALSDQIIQGDAGQLAAMSREDFLSLLS